MPIRNTGSPYGGGPGATDHFIGKAYPHVKKVADNMSVIKFVADHINELKPNEIALRYDEATEYIQWSYVGTDVWFNLTQIEGVSDAHVNTLIEAALTAALTAANYMPRSDIGTAVPPLVAGKVPAEYLPPSSGGGTSAVTVANITDATALGRNILLTPTAAGVRALLGITEGGEGAGDVSGPASSLNGELVSFSGTTGKVVVGSGMTASSITTNLSAKQNILVSGGNIKTINGQTLLGSGDLTISGGGGGGSGDVVGPINSVDEEIAVFSGSSGKLIKRGGNFLSNITGSIATKQSTLVSGSNLKTVNGESLLGGGNITISGGGGGGTTKKRIVVIGDSMSSQSDLLQPAWPEILEQSMRAYGADCEVHNLSIIGLQFQHSGSSGHYGGLSATAKAINLNPDVVILAMGANDTITGTATFAAIQSIVDGILNNLRTNLPSAAIIYGSQRCWDNTHNSTGAGVLNRQVCPWAMQTATSGSFAGLWSQDILPNAARSEFPAKFEQWTLLDNYVKAHSAVNGSFTVDQFKMARLGLTGLDGLHPNGEGSKLIASWARKAMYTIPSVAAHFPNMRGSLYPLYEDADTIFNEFVESSGGQWIDRAPRNPGEDGYQAREHVSAHQSNLSAIRASAWFLPSKGSFRPSPTTVGVGGILTMTVSSALPNKQTYLSTDGGAGVLIPLITDNSGNGSWSNTASNILGGSHVYRLIVGAEMYGPFTITNSGSTPVGDVAGPASSVANRIAVYSNTTGKVIADGGRTIAELDTAINGKQATLVSGTNIKTVNGVSLVGSGNVVTNSPANARIYVSSAGSWSINASPTALSLTGVGEASGVTASGGMLTIQTTGVYVINGNILGTANTGLGVIAAIIINGAGRALGSVGRSQTTGGFAGSSVSITIALTAGATVQLGYVADGAGSYASAEANVFLSLAKVG